MNYTQIVEPHQGKTATSAEKTGVYVDRPGEVTGEIRLVRSWFAIGQEVSFVMCSYYLLDI